MSAVTGTVTSMADRDIPPDLYRRRAADRSYRFVDDLIDRITLLADGDFRQQLHSALSDFVTFVEAYASSYSCRRSPC